jgi:hypothetical protein
MEISRSADFTIPALSLIAMIVTLLLGCVIMAVPSSRYVEGGTPRHYWVNAATQAVQPNVFNMIDVALPTLLNCRKASTNPPIPSEFGTS